MQPALPNSCRVLELGCATGGNIIPMADRLSGSQFVGVDYSRAQLEIAERTAAQVQLKNLEFKHADIAQLGTSLGKFDYILCHGVFSWVSDDLQDKILELIRDSLTPQGVAYISYNTHPGWYLRLTVREMLCSYAPPEDTATVRTAKGRALLQFFERATERESSHYSKLLKAECEMIGKYPDGYIYHEYFESDNRPLFFHQFVAHAQKFALQYVGETQVHSMFTTGCGPETESHLQGLAFDLIAGEQHLDVVRNRAFRQSLLSHWGVPLVRHLTAANLEGLRFTGRFTPTSKIDDLSTREPATFKGPNGVTFNTSAPILKAAMKAINDHWPRNYSFDELHDAALRILGFSANPIAVSPQAREGLGQNLVQCLAHGLIEIHGLPDDFVTTISERPLASRLARYEAQVGGQVTNRRHELSNLDEPTRVVLSFLDGNHDRDSLLRELLEAVNRGDVTIMVGGLPKTKLQETEPILKATLAQSLEMLAENAFLIA
jgi:methyltransferase-like protein/cyclopropane fatty-acyl-phospholipid synthase-like methyltransferase